MIVLDENDRVILIDDELAEPEAAYRGEPELFVRQHSTACTDSPANIAA